VSVFLNFAVDYQHYLCRKVISALLSHVQHVPLQCATDLASCTVSVHKKSQVLSEDK
jgi:hypothetical protein